MNEQVVAATGRLALSTTPATPRNARNSLRDLLATSGWRGDVEGAVLMMSEVATNALVHAGAIGTVTMTITDDVLHVSTRDASKGLPVPLPPAERQCSGRGLPIVSEIADGWGVEPCDGGKTVWFELRPR